MSDNLETRNSNNLDSVTEPGVISKSMIIDAYFADDLKGEESRLHRMEPIVYKNVTALRLNYKNILRIDHLWVLPNLTKLSLNYNRIERIENLDMLINLKELDLSFNYIEKISNLDKLINLEILTLFSNLIVKIENLDKLEKLIIFSIGNNMIDSTNGIERLRFLTHLKVLNLEGNPICKEITMVDYVAAILPNVKYYNYIYIKNGNRKKAKELFHLELRDIEANEEIELKKRTKLAENNFNAKFLTNSFVVHLSENQLFESMWMKTDKNGQTFLLVGNRAQDVINEYRKDVLDITQEIYKLGLLRSGERQTESDEFINNLESDHLQFQEIGKKILDEFMVFKEKLFEKVMQKEDDKDNKMIESINNLADVVNETLNDLRQKLMRLELHLHEATEDVITTFERNIQNMITYFVEEAQVYFSQLRDLATYFAENSYEIFSTHVATMLSTEMVKPVDGVGELKEYVQDEDAIRNLIDNMKKFHVQQIDGYEDQLILHSREFLKNMIDKLRNDELKRNRMKILEINVFLDTMTEELQNFCKI